MMVPGTRAAQRQMQEEAKKEQERQISKKIDSFRQGRDPQNFPGIKLDVSDKDFVALLSDLDLVYIAVHKMQVIFVKYSRSINGKFNLFCLFSLELYNSNKEIGMQAEKMYPEDHKRNPIAKDIADTHSSFTKHYKDFLENHSQTYALFKQLYSKFEQINLRLKVRDKAMDRFKHYFYKLKKINEEKTIRKKIGDIDHERDDNEVEYIARNEKKYQQAFKEFQELNSSLYQDISELIRKKYKLVTPIISQFIVQAQIFFSKGAKQFYHLSSQSTNERGSDPQDLGYGDQEEDEEEPKPKKEKRKKKKKQVSSSEEDEDEQEALEKEVKKIKKHDLRQRQQQQQSDKNLFERLEEEEINEAKQAVKKQKQKEEMKKHQHSHSSNNLAQYAQAQQYSQKQQSQQNLQPVPQQNQQQYASQQQQQQQPLYSQQQQRQQQQYPAQQNYLNVQQQQPHVRQKSADAFAYQQQMQQQQQYFNMQSQNPQYYQNQQYYQQPRMNHQYSQQQYQVSSEDVSNGLNVAKGIGGFLDDIGINKETVAKGIIGAFFGGGSGNDNQERQRPRRQQRQQNYYYDEEDDDDDDDRYYAELDYKYQNQYNQRRKQ